jgi:hypothetical protein
MCKNHSQKLATRQISIHLDATSNWIRSTGLRKQILFESFDPVDVTFSSWFLHFVQHRQCFSAFNLHSRSEQNNWLFITPFYFFKTMFFFTVLINLYFFLIYLAHSKLSQSEFSTWFNEPIAFRYLYRSWTRDICKISTSKCLGE